MDDSPVFCDGSMQLVQFDSDSVKQLTMILASEKKMTEENVSIVSYDEFVKIDMRVGVILEAEEIPKADKLLKLQVDLGTEKRQIVAGIKQHYDAQSLIGKHIVVVTNFEPRVLRGETSHGMLLAASNTDKVTLVTLDSAMAAGSKIG